jgi:hypothetical protein
MPYRFKIQIPFHEGGHLNQLASIFELLEKKKESLGIRFYNVSKLNLEKMFIDLSRRQFEADEILASERQSAINEQSFRPQNVEEF